MHVPDEWRDVRGTRLRCSVRAGTEDRRPLLLLNGLGAPLETWGPLREQLPGRTTVAYDAPGTGASPLATWPLGIAGHADLSCALLDCLGIDRADVLGYSFGGTIAQELARRHPDRVGALVLASTSCGWGATLGDPVTLSALAWSLPRAMVSAGGALRPPTPLGVWWQMLAVGTWSSWPWLPTLDAPTLVISGAGDRVVPPANAEALAARIPGAELALIPDAGHFLVLADDPSGMATPVAQFLDRQDVAVVST